MNRGSFLSFRRMFTGFVVLLTTILIPGFSDAQTSVDKYLKIAYPKTYKGDLTDTYFENKISDPYRWLENDNAENTREWIVEQNKITSNYLSKQTCLTSIKKRLLELFNYKFAARLQEYQNSNAPVLIRIESNVGHGYGKPVLVTLEEIAEQWAFMFNNIGLKCN